MIKLDQVTKVYRMGEVEVNALRGVTLTVANGEMIAVMGPSGSGKSTLMNILGCLDVPSSGQYFLEGVEIGTLNDNHLAEVRNRKIGFVFQTYNLLPRTTALNNVLLPLLYGNTHEGKQSAVNALAQVGLTERARHHPSELSGGEQQRVGIARALVKNPSILLADEPTGNLDSKSSMQILGILQQLNQERGITIIIVTHELDIARHTSRIVSMRDGEIVNDESVVEPQVAWVKPNI